MILLLTQNPPLNIRWFDDRQASLDQNICVEGLRKITEV
jgi:hypothetical protein